MALVRDFMDKDVIILEEEMTLREASMILLKNSIPGAPVVDSGKNLCGFITERDIINRIKENFASSGLPLHLSLFDAVFLHDPSVAERDRFESEAAKIAQVNVRDAMWKKVISVGADDSIELAIHYLSKYRINRMPVTENGKIVGLISRKNILDSIFKIMEKKDPSDQA